MFPQSAFEEISQYRATAHILSAAVLEPPSLCTVQHHIHSVLTLNAHKKYSRSFVKLLLNSCRMGYCTDVLATFLDLDRVRTLAVYGRVRELTGCIKVVLSSYQNCCIQYLYQWKSTVLCTKLWRLPFMCSGGRGWKHMRFSSLCVVDKIVHLRRSFIHTETRRTCRIHI